MAGRAVPCRGFTLIEMAVVLVLISIIAAAVFKGQFLFRAGETQEVMALARDIGVASQAFRQRYRYLPGDFPIDQTNPEIPGVSAACRLGGDNAGNGNGLIDGNEPPCVAEHLIRAGLLKGDPAAAITSRFGRVRVVERTASAVPALPEKILNVVELIGLPCEMAREIDRKLDDDKLDGGNIRSFPDRCVGEEGITLVVPL